MLGGMPLNGRPPQSYHEVHLAATAWRTALRHRLGLAASLLALAVIAPPARSDCPVTTYVTYPAPFVSHGLVHDTTFTFPTFNTTASGRYNVGAGQIGAESQSPCCVANIEAVHEDDFTLIGIAPGTPFTLTATAQFTGRVISNDAPPPIGDGGASITGRLRDALGNEVTAGTSVGGTGDIALDRTVSLPVTGTAGTPFRLRFSAEALTKAGFATIQGELSFALPAGASLISCRGYNSAAPVPVRTATWGSIKALYR